MSNVPHALKDFIQPTQQGATHVQKEHIQIKQVPHHALVVQLELMQTPLAHPPARLVLVVQQLMMEAIMEELGAIDAHHAELENFRTTLNFVIIVQ